VSGRIKIPAFARPYDRAFQSDTGTDETHTHPCVGLTENPYTSELRIVTLMKQTTEQPETKSKADDADRAHLQDVGDGCSCTEI